MSRRVRYVEETAPAVKTRTLAKGRQWIGRDAPNGQAVERRRRQLAAGRLSTSFVPALSNRKA